MLVPTPYGRLATSTASRSPATAAISPVVASAMRRSTPLPASASANRLEVTVDLVGDHLGAGGRQRPGQAAGAGAHLDDEIARPHPRGDDDPVDEARLGQEVLAEPFVGVVPVSGEQLDRSRPCPGRRSRAAPGRASEDPSGGGGGQRLHDLAARSPRPRRAPRRPSPRWRAGWATPIGGGVRYGVSVSTMVRPAGVGRTPPHRVPGLEGDRPGEREGHPEIDEAPGPPRPRSSSGEHPTASPSPSDSTASWTSAKASRQCTMTGLPNSAARASSVANTRRCACRGRRGCDRSRARTRPRRRHPPPAPGAGPAVPPRCRRRAGGARRTSGPATGGPRRCGAPPASSPGRPPGTPPSRRRRPPPGRAAPAAYRPTGRGGNGCRPSPSGSVALVERFQPENSGTGSGRQMPDGHHGVDATRSATAPRSASTRADVAVQIGTEPDGEPGDGLEGGRQRGGGATRVRLGGGPRLAIVEVGVDRRGAGHHALQPGASFTPRIISSASVSAASTSASTARSGRLESARRRDDPLEVAVGHRRHPVDQVAPGGDQLVR